MKMKTTMPLVVVACIISCVACFAVQRDQEDTLGRTLSTGRPIELPTLEKSKHIPTDPDEIVPPKAQNKKYDAVQA